TMDRRPPQIPPAVRSSLPPLPPPGTEGAGEGSRRWRLAVLWSARIAARFEYLCPVLGSPPTQRVGGLRQASFRGTGSRAGVSRPLHAPRRHQQPATPGAPGWPSLLRLDRLPRLPPQGDDCPGRGVHPPLFAARPAPWFPAHSLLRLPGQPPSRRSACTLSQPAGHALLASAAQTYRLP